MLHGVDEYFLDFEEDEKKKRHYQYFENKNLLKNIKNLLIKFVNI